MIPSDAAKILDLPADSTPAQLETRFHELRTKLEERIGRAPTPGLKAKYRESLDEITQAFETLTLAADASNLPSLRRAAPTPSPWTQPVALEPPPAAPAGPPVLAPTTVALLHLAGFIKFILTALLVGLGVAILLFLIVHPTDDGVGFVLDGGAALTAIVAGILLWRRSVRRARQRLAEGRKNTFDNVAAILVTSLTLLVAVVGSVAFNRMNRENDERWADDVLKEIATAGVKSDQQVAAAQQAEQEATKFLSELEASEQALTVARDDPAKLRGTRALIRAQATYVRWFGESLPIQPAQRARLKLDNLRDRLAADHADHALTGQAQDALRDYRQRAVQVGFTIANHKPDPVYAENFEDWQQQAAQGADWAMYNLYLTYVDRHGPVEPDLAIALDWLRRAAAANNPGAMQVLAERLWNGRGMAASKTEATSWHRKAAETGQAGSMTFLGECYLTGDGLPQDPTLGAEWLRKAAEAGGTRGMYRFGQCLAKGEGVARDEKTAIEWWIKAARLNEYDARLELNRRKITW